MKAKHFKIQELVSERVYNEYGQYAWNFFDPRLIETIDWIRGLFNKPVYANDWYRGGHLQQRGLRENLSPIVREKTLEGTLYLSGHTMGRALDFDVEGMTAEEVRRILIRVADQLPYPIRIEKDVNWVHVDMMDMGVPVYLFNR